MEAITYFAQQSMKRSVPELRAGDTVRVHQRIREGTKERVQIFEGVVMAVRGGMSINSSYVVRYVHTGTRVGVEKTFPLHSPNVVKVERLKSSKVRQARLFYLRERFGRMARMRGEVRSADDWHEKKGLDENTEPEAIDSSLEDESTVEREANDENATEEPIQDSEDEADSPEDGAQEAVPESVEKPSE